LKKKKEALGSYGYFPPEMILNKRYNLNIDFWNIGIICFYFLFKFFPFGKSSEIGDIKQFDVNKFVKEYHFENEKYSFFIEKIKEIIYSCLNFDINQRGKDLKDIINE
jgi:serine/threonine protein kinase